MKSSQRLTHALIWSAGLVLMPVALYVSLRGPLQSAPGWSRVTDRAQAGSLDIDYEVQGPEGLQLLDLYIPDNFSYPAVVARAISADGERMDDLGPIAGAGTYRFDLPPGTAEVWLFDTVQGKTVYQISL